MTANSCAAAGTRRGLSEMLALVTACGLLIAAACSSSTSGQQKPSRRAVPKLPLTPLDYASEDWPRHFFEETEFFEMQRPLIEEDNTPKNNAISNAGATLGRVLFYDASLSKNSTISCASCHKVHMGFGDERRLSIGFGGGKTARHSMGLTNARFYGEGLYFWDQRAETLEEQVLMPFQDPVEMGMTLDGLVSQITKTSYYAPLFAQAFGDSQVTPERIARALAQFVRSMVSTTSRYDEGRAKVQRRSDPFPNFSELENLGKQLFVMPQGQGGLGCFTCHRGEGFVAALAMTNGLEASLSGDPGYGIVSGQQRDLGTFKVPSLRNVALRPPYMHDGRFATLAEVIDHYSDSVQAHPNLSIPFLLHGGTVRQLALNQTAKDALLAFLETLSDPKMLADPKFSDPFAL